MGLTIVVVSNKHDDDNNIFLIVINFIEYFSYKLESYMYLVKIKKYLI